MRDEHIEFSDWFSKLDLGEIGKSGMEYSKIDKFRMLILGSIDSRNNISYFIRDRITGIVSLVAEQRMLGIVQIKRIVDFCDKYSLELVVDCESTFGTLGESRRPRVVITPKYAEVKQ